MPGLTSPALLAFLAVMAGVLLAGVIWGWPSLARPGGPMLAGRLAVLVALQAAMLALTFLVVNASGGFFSSWSDLFGRYTGGGTLASLHEGTTARSTALIAVRAVEPIRLAGRPQPAGTLETVLIRGQLSGITLRGHVYLPPGYPRTAGPGGRYPVIVAISAGQASAAAPYGARALAIATARQILAGRLRPLILLALPPGPGADHGCLNVPAGPQATTFFAQDVPAAMASAYRPQPGGWGLLGDASGGYCALQLALTNAPVFGAAAVPSGSYLTPPGPPGWGNSPQLRIADNLVWLVGHQPMQPVRLLFTGPGGAGAFAALPRPPMRVSTAPGTAAGPAISWLGDVLTSTGMGG